MTLQKLILRSWVELLTMIIIIYASVLALFYLDHETDSIFQFLNLQSLPIVLIYFLPAFLISLSLLIYLNRRRPALKNLIISLAIGIPTGFSLVMILFWFA